MIRKYYVADAIGRGSDNFEISNKVQTNGKMCISKLRSLINSYDKEEISMSKFLQEINDHFIANKSIISMEQLQTKSRFQIGDKVNLNFFTSGKIKNASIEAVKFNEGSVYYDASVVVTQEGLSTVLENISSAFVEPMDSMEY